MIMTLDLTQPDPGLNSPVMEMGGGGKWPHLGDLGGRAQSLPPTNSLYKLILLILFLQGFTYMYFRG